MHKNSLQKITILCLFIDVVTILIILVARKNLPPIIPLFYGLPVSDSVLAPNLGLAIPAILSGVSVSINLGLNSLLKDSFLEQILSGLAIALTALSVIAVAKIILLV